jgi:hypothetical protein
MMFLLCALVFLSDGYPLWAAWRANRRTALIHALGWGIAAWAAWTAAMLLASRVPDADAGVLRYLGLCTTGCALVAVLGARQPGAAAWNLVVVGLLAVLLLPLAEQVLSGGRLQVEWFRAVLVGGVLAVGVLNYLPTRLGSAAVVMALGSTLALLRLTSVEKVVQGFDLDGSLGCLIVSLAPWVGFAGIRKRRAEVSEFDRVWRDFRDRFGLVWGQRLREQFNRSATHAGWPVHLTWQGLRRRSGTTALGHVSESDLLATLGALMKRFGSASGS